MADDVQCFTMDLSPEERPVTVRLDPRNELVEIFLSRDMGGSTHVEEALIDRAERARAGRPGTYGLDSFALYFTPDGVILEHCYREGNPSVIIELDNFVHLAQTYAAAQRRQDEASDQPGHPR